MDCQKIFLIGMKLDKLKIIQITGVVKIFTSVLERRMRMLLEENEIIDEAQTGLRSDHSTVNNVFVLHAFCQKCLRKHKHSFYVAFINFRKAFDLVDRQTHIYNIYNIQGMWMYYGKVKACIRADNYKSGSFSTSCGVRHG